MRHTKLPSWEGLGLGSRFPASTPLSDRFGRDFFLTVPAQPGVYFFRDAFQGIIYIGQSQNLKERLRSYRYVHPDRDSGRLVRLIHTIDSIAWETCVTARQARLKESELLREYRPRFNRMNTDPGACLFIAVKRRQEGLELSLTRELQPDLELFGAFQPHCIAAFVALSRLAFVYRRKPTSLAEFPCGLLEPSARRPFSVFASDSSQEAFAEAVVSYLSGESERVVECLKEAVQRSAASEAFAQKLLALDLETIQQFYVLGPKRNAALRKRFLLGDDPISPEQLQDLSALDGIGEAQFDNGR